MAILPLLPGLPSELAASRVGSVIATVKLEAAPCPEIGGGTNRFPAAVPLRSKPAWFAVFSALARPAARVSRFESEVGIF